VSAAVGSAGNNITLGQSNNTGVFAWNNNNTTLSGGADADDTGTNFSTSPTASVNAAHLAAAINRNSGSLGVTAASSPASGVVIVDANAPGTAGNGITLAETVTTGFSWTSGTTAGGLANQPSLVAFNNLYSGTVPTTGLC